MRIVLYDISNTFRNRGRNQPMLACYDFGCGYTVASKIKIPALLGLSLLSLS